MTSFAFILGVVPLVMAEGAGAEMRRSLGTAVFSGMLGVTLFGIFLTPCSSTSSKLGETQLPLPDPAGPLACCAGMAHGSGADVAAGVRRRLARPDSCGSRGCIAGSLGRRLATPDVQRRRRS